MPGCLRSRAALRITFAPPAWLPRSRTTTRPLSNLLRRGLDLLPPESQQALEIRVMLAGSLGDVEDARLINAFLLETVELAERLRDPAAAARAETARLQVAGWLGEGEMVDLLGRAQSLRQTLENLGDEEGALAAGEREILMLFWLGRCGEASRDGAVASAPGRRTADRAGAVALDVRRRLLRPDPG